MDANKVLAVLRDAASHFHGNGIRPHSDFMALIAEAEHEAQAPGENDWQSTVGMFAGDAEMQAISEETRSVREAHKVEVPVFAVVFDDADRQPEIFLGEDAARERFSSISVSWNAHLFVKVQSNSRDERYFSNNKAPLSEQEPGGWKPGTEPPKHENEVNLAFYGCYVNEGLKVTMGYYDLEDKMWFDHWDRPFPDVKWWHDLPPLPVLQGVCQNANAGLLLGEGEGEAMNKVTLRVMRRLFGIAIQGVAIVCGISAVAYGLYVGTNAIHNRLHVKWVDIFAGGMIFAVIFTLVSMPTYWIISDFLLSLRHEAEAEIAREEEAEATGSNVLLRASDGKRG